MRGILKSAKKLYYKSDDTIILVLNAIIVPLLALINAIPERIKGTILNTLTFSIVSWLAANWLLVTLRYKNVLNEIKVSETIHRIATSPEYLKPTAAIADDIVRIRRLVEDRQDASELIDLFPEQALFYLRRCASRVNGLTTGTIRFTGNVCSEKTGECFHRSKEIILATSFPSLPGPEIEEEPNQSYMHDNEAALQNGVKIKRYFILSKDYLAKKNFQPFMNALKQHISLRENNKDKTGTAGYTLKYVMEESVNFRAISKDFKHIPDVSYFDNVLVSTWHVRSGKGHLAEIDSSSLEISNDATTLMDRMFKELDKESKSVNNEADLLTQLNKLSALYARPSKELDSAT